jgi:hypothetical protein
MLNGYAFQKRLEEYNKMEKDKVKEEKTTQVFKYKREDMARNYKIRVDRFIHEVSKA